MHLFIVDDDPNFRSMLMDIIEDENFGEIVGESDDGEHIDANILSLKQVDILLIDLLMPEEDGIETIRRLGSSFQGKIVMISQIESKDMIGEAYALGIEYYITKPINRLEVLSVLQKVKERIIMQRSIHSIQQSLNVLELHPETKKNQPYTEDDIRTPGHYLLSELGMVGESGSEDLLDILEYLYLEEKKDPTVFSFPALKHLFLHVIRKNVGDSPKLQKEIRASEQRVRRAIYHALKHIASLGLTDYAMPAFENYTKFFEFTEVRKKMTELLNEQEASSPVRINMRKFIQTLYVEAKRHIK